QTTFLLIFFLISTIVGLMYFGTKRLVFFLLLFTFATGMYVKSVDYTYNNVLKPHQKNRIGVILGKIEDKKGVGYNLNQSKIAIGSGGVWGKGFLHGTQNKGNFVPEIHTDFIFCTIGEEFGFVGSAVFISLFVFLLVRIVSIAERQRSRFSRIYAYSIASILFFHFGVNIAMTIGLMPVIGIPLPFISYGGSSLLGFSLMVFTLLKLDTERNAYV
ncbi:MAG TPA: rod shape-determining protein RodA, partial [Chitinophagales bacterium]|nr:rod shape-determining protein RodA [Chitinophagales bacterium]